MPYITVTACNIQEAQAYSTQDFEMRPAWGNGCDMRKCGTHGCVGDAGSGVTGNSLVWVWQATEWHARVYQVWVGHA